MLDPICNKCKKYLIQPGAILFGPPQDIDSWDYTPKFHLCCDCFHEILTLINPYE